jgi:hypothetical protein
MRYADIKDGKVVNVVIAEPDVAAERGWVACSDEVGIDWDYDGTSFIDNRPEPVAPVQPVEPTKEELLQQLQTLSERIQALT